MARNIVTAVLVAGAFAALYFVVRGNPTAPAGAWASSSAPVPAQGEAGPVASAPPAVTTQAAAPNLGAPSQPGASAQPGGPALPGSPATPPTPLPGPPPGALSKQTLTAVLESV